LELNEPERSEGSYAARPHQDSRSVDGGERSDPADSPAGNAIGAGCRPGGEAGMTVEQAARTVIRERLKQAGEWVYARGRVDHPCFASARVAADNLLRLLPAVMPVLVMRDQCLRPLREMLLELDRPLIVPDKAGTCVYRIPRSALYASDGRRTAEALHVDPLPFGSKSYAETVGAVVVACLAFDPSCGRLYSFDTDRTAAMLEEMREGLPTGFQLAADTPVIAMAHDAQQVDDWPDEALGFAEADVAITPTRAVFLGTGEVIGLEAGKGLVCSNNTQGRCDYCGCS
jgi:hypothetical protein